MKKKILHIIVGLGNGGAENTLFKLTKKLKKKFDFSILILSNENSLKWKFQKENIKLIQLNSKNKLFFIFKLFEIYRIIKKINPDLIQSWMYHSDFIASIIGKIFLNKRVIWCVRHSNLKIFQSKLFTIILAKLCAFLSIKYTDKIIYSSRMSKNYHEQIGYDKLKAIEIFNGYDPKKNKFIKIKNRKITNLGLLANYRPQKDFKTLLKSLSILRKKKVKFKCIMAGQNVNKNNTDLKHLINFYNLNDYVTLKGQLNNTKSFFENIDFQVLSSSFGESFPNVLAEAMLHGIPCISTDVGDAKKIVSKYGWISKISNPNHLSQNILKAIKFKENEKQKFKKNRKNARNSIIDRFHINNMTNKYSFLWNKVINK